MHLPPKEKLIGGAALLAITVGVACVGATRMRPDEPLRIQAVSESSSHAAPTPDTSGKIVVDVAGEVVHRGIVTLNAGARIDDAIKAAGGMKATADADALNLATKLSDGDQVRVPTKGLATTPIIGPLSVVIPKTHASIKRQKPTKAAPVHKPEPSMKDQLAEMDRLVWSMAKDNPSRPALDGGSVWPQPTAAPKSDPASTSAQTATVSLNSANEADLERLPGVGPATAKKILDYRAQIGRFSSIDQLLSVRGIGPAKLAKMRAFLTL